MEQNNLQETKGTDLTSVPSLSNKTTAPLYTLNGKNDSKPNAYIVKNSRYIKRAERDARLYKSPQHDDYLFPLVEADLVEKLSPLYVLIETFDSLAEEVPLVRELTTKLLRNQDELREKTVILTEFSLQSGRPINDAEYAVDLTIREVYGRCQQLNEENARISEQIAHIRSPQKNAPKVSRLITLSHEELVLRNIPEREFVLKPWLPTAAISMVYAPPGIGKSYLCLTAAGTIASGGRLFTHCPWEAPKPKRVLYIDGEMHEADLQTRIRKLMRPMNIPNNHLRYLNGSWQKNFIPDLSTPEGQALINEIIKEQQIEVIFLDNLSTLCRTGRENEAESWQQMQSWLLQLRWQGIAIVLIHHAGKTKDENGNPRQRGTSMKEVVLESTIVLKHPKDYSEEMGCVFELAFPKARGFYGAEAAPALIKLVEKDGMFCWEDQKLAAKTYEAVVDLYLAGTTRSKDIGAVLGISPQAISKHINNAKKKGDLA